MALIASISLLLTVFMLGCLALACGTRMLGWLGLSGKMGLEEELYAAGFFFVVLEVLLFILSLFGWLRPIVVWIVLAGAALIAGKAWRQPLRLAAALVRRLRWAIRSPLILAIAILIIGCTLLDAFLAMAPLTGSDAMLYHFTAPMLEVGKRWEPLYWLTFSFYTGLGHILIQLGMTLGSDRISTGLIYLTGLMTAGGLFVLTRRIASEGWAWLAVLTFLLTPMVYWQIGTSGCPDIWMAFYTTLVVLAAARGIERGGQNWWCLAGIFAGAVAGVKYTAWSVPAALVLCSFVATRSLRRSVACGVCSLVAGILPLVRNAWWSNDPFFPFLSRWLNPQQFNSYTLDTVLANLQPTDTDRTPLGLLKYPFVFPLQWNAYGGFGHSWGPLVLAFAPLLVFSVRRKPLSMAAILVWAVVLLTNELTAQQPRYLLAAFPLALALVFAGAAEALQRGWRLVRVAVIVSLLSFLTFGVCSEALYARDFLPVAVGMEKQEVFLQRMAPDYPAVAFINRSLDRGEGRVMVFLRYTYYLRVPFEMGDPSVSWLMNPDKLAEPSLMLRFLRQENLRWIVKVADYPQPFAPTLQMLEREGKLRPVASTDVPIFTGFRLYRQKGRARVVILEVQPGPALDQANASGPFKTP